MRFVISASFCAGVLAASMLAPTFAAVTVQEPKADAKAEAPDIAAMMAKARKFTQPSQHHKELERFLGRWNTETRIFMGAQASPAEKGEAEFAWLMPGRWLKGESKGTMMGMPAQSFLLMGYDNFKQSFVTTMVSSLDTAMTHSEGDMDPSGKTLLTYGTLDEYLTGEHDKMVKYVWRFPSPNKIVLEVHDLPIGEHHTKVVEITYERKSS